MNAYGLRISAILFAFVIPGVTASSIAGAADGKRQPNVVFILADDLGIGDVRCFGGDRCRIETPGFDQLAREELNMGAPSAKELVIVESGYTHPLGRQ